MIKKLFSKLFKTYETPEEIQARLYELTDKEDYGIFNSCMDAQTALNELKRYFLGENWCVVDPISQDQINAQIVYEIELKHKLKDINFS